MKSLSRKATTRPPISANTLFFGASYKTINVIINIIVFIILVKSKYHIPIPKEHNIITVTIHILIITDIVPLPFEYQHINAKIGENNVIPYHIII